MKTTLFLFFTLLVLSSLSAQNKLFFDVGYSQRPADSFMTYGVDYGLGIEHNDHYSIRLHYINTWRAKAPKSDSLIKPLLDEMQIGLSQSYAFLAKSRLRVWGTLNTSLCMFDRDEFVGKSYFTFQTNHVVKHKSTFFYIEPGIQLSYRVVKGIRPYIGAYYGLPPVGVYKGIPSNPYRIAIGFRVDLKTFEPKE